MPLERLYEGHRLWLEPWTARGGETFVYHCPASELEDQLEAIAGPLTVYSTGWGGSVTRRLPMEHPERPGLFAVRAQAEGMGRSSASGLYSWYKLTVEFDSPPYQLTGDTPFMSIRRAAGVSHITVPGMYLRQVSDNKVLNHDGAVPVPVVHYLVTVFGLSAINDVAISDAMAAPLNSSTLYLPGATIAAGYALFNSVEDQNDFSYGGVVTRSITYKFAFRSTMKWTEIISPYSGNVDRPILPNGNNLIEASDLNLLFLD